MSPRRALAVDDSRLVREAPFPPAPQPPAIDFVHRTIRVNGTQISGIAAKRFDVLAALLRHEGPMSQEELLSELWDCSHDLKTVQMTVARLREDLKAFTFLQIVTEAHCYRLVIHPVSRRR